MKLLSALAFVTAVLAFSSCKKCETCVPYTYILGKLATTPDSHTQTVKLCDKVEITAYESLTNFTDANEDTVRFICK